MEVDIHFWYPLNNPNPTILYTVIYVYISYVFALNYKLLDLKINILVISVQYSGTCHVVCTQCIFMSEI